MVYIDITNMLLYHLNFLDNIEPYLTIGYNKIKYAQCGTIYIIKYNKIKFIQ
jgi:hypothetical protein